jgi:uncharacterized membrane protein
MNEDIARTPREMVDVPGLFKRSWALFQSKPIEHLVASLIVLVLSVISLGVLLGPLMVGQIRMIEKQERGEDPRIEDVFTGFGNFGAAFLTTLILFVGMIIGLVLLVVPGLVVGAAWSFALWFVALEDASAVDALGRSWQLLKAHALSVVVLIVLLAVVNVLANTIIVTALITTPLTMIFWTLAFQDMLATSAARGQNLAD